MNGALVRHLSHDYHPPTKGFLEMVIKSRGHLLSLEILLSCLVSENLRAWNSVLSTAEFAYNSSIKKITSISPFEIVTVYRPKAPIDLIPMFASHRPSKSASAFASHIHSLH